MYTDIRTFPINMSNRAVEIIKKSVMDKNREYKILRISVEGGGCSGFKYGLNFVRNIDANDILCRYTKEITIAIDINSYLCMKLTTIDFVTTKEGSGFVFQNPSATDSCNGCD